VIVIEPRLNSAVVLMVAVLVTTLVVWWLPRQHRLWAGILLATGLPSLALFWLGVTPQAVYLNPDGLVVTNHLGTPTAQYRKGELGEIATDWEIRCAMS